MPKVLEADCHPSALPHLSALHGDLQDEGQATVVKVLIQGDEGTVHATLQQIVAVLLQADGLYPVYHPVVGPHQNVCAAAHTHGKASCSVLSHNSSSYPPYV